MSEYGVFIIESLRANDYLDGDNLHEILKLSLIPTRYEWADNVEDFKRLLIEFNKSNFRYLHISCHADEKGFEINGEEISNVEIQEMTKNKLKNKRLFLSVCKGGNRDIASRIIIGNGASSVLGVPSRLSFDKSALFWPSFYHLVNEIDDKKMNRELIIDVVKKLVQLFSIPVNYYSKILNSKTYLRRLKIRKHSIDNRKIKAAL